MPRQSNSCELCERKGNKGQLRLYQINFEEAVWLCDNPQCLWPLGTKNTTGLIVQRKASELTCKKRKAAPRWRPPAARVPDVIQSPSLLPDDSLRQDGMSPLGSTFLTSSETSTPCTTDFNFGNFSIDGNNVAVLPFSEGVSTEVDKWVQSHSSLFLEGHNAQSVDLPELSSSPQSLEGSNGQSVDLPELSSSPQSLEGNNAQSVDLPELSNSPRILEGNNGQSVDLPESRNSPQSLEDNNGQSMDLSESSNSPRSLEGNDGQSVDLPELSNSPKSLEGNNVQSVDLPVSSNSPQSLEGHNVKSVDVPELSSSPQSLQLTPESTSSPSTKTITDCSSTRRYPQWMNRDNLCWLHASLCLIVHNQTLRQHFSSLNGRGNCMVKTILEVYARAITVLDDQNEDTCNRPLPSLAPNHIKNVEVREILDAVCEICFHFLQPKLRCKLGQEDSPVFVLPLLLGQNNNIRRVFVVEYWWAFKCEVCGSKKKDRVKKVIPTFPSTGDHFSVPSAYFLRPCFSCSAPNQKSHFCFKSLPPCLALHFEKGLPSSDISAYSFSHKDTMYVVTAVIQYIATVPRHFVTWARHVSGNSWLCTDDLSPNLLSSEFETPPVLDPAELHILVWEKMQPSNDLMPNRPVPATVDMAALSEEITLPNNGNTLQSDLPVLKNVSSSETKDQMLSMGHINSNDESYAIPADESSEAVLEATQKARGGTSDCSKAKTDCSACVSEEQDPNASFVSTVASSDTAVKSFVPHEFDMTPDEQCLVYTDQVTPNSFQDTFRQVSVDALFQPVSTAQTGKLQVTLLCHDVSEIESNNPEFPYKLETVDLDSHGMGLCTGGMDPFLKPELLEQFVASPLFLLLKDTDITPTALLSRMRDWFGRSHVRAVLLMKYCGINDRYPVASSDIGPHKSSIYQDHCYPTRSQGHRSDGLVCRSIILKEFGIQSMVPSDKTLLVLEIPDMDMYWLPGNYLDFQGPAVPLLPIRMHDLIAFLAPAMLQGVQSDNCEMVDIANEESNVVVEGCDATTFKLTKSIMCMVKKVPQSGPALVILHQTAGKGKSVHPKSESQTTAGNSRRRLVSPRDKAEIQQKVARVNPKTRSKLKGDDRSNPTSAKGNRRSDNKQIWANGAMQTPNSRKEPWEKPIVLDKTFQQLLKSNPGLKKSRWFIMSLQENSSKCQKPKKPLKVDRKWETIIPESFTLDSVFDKRGTECQTPTKRRKFRHTPTLGGTPVNGSLTPASPISLQSDFHNRNVTNPSNSVRSLLDFDLTDKPGPVSQQLSHKCQNNLVKLRFLRRGTGFAGYTFDTGDKCTKRNTDTVQNRSFSPKCSDSESQSTSSSETATTVGDDLKFLDDICMEGNVNALMYDEVLSDLFNS